MPCIFLKFNGLVQEDAAADAVWAKWIQSMPSHSIEFYNIHSNVIVQSTPWSSKWSLSFNFAHYYLPSHACQIPFDCTSLHMIILPTYGDNKTHTPCTSTLWTSSSILLLPPPYIPIFSATCPQEDLVYVLPLLLETGCPNTHIRYRNVQEL